MSPARFLRVPPTVRRRLCGVWRWLRIADKCLVVPAAVGVLYGLLMVLIAALTCVRGSCNSGCPGAAVVPLYRRPLTVRTFYYATPNRPHVGYGGASARRLFERHGWEEARPAHTADDWDLLWTFMPQYTALPPGLPRRSQRHNHCMGLAQAWGIHGTKESQWACFAEMRRLFGDRRFGYMPETFVLPSQVAAWRAASVADPGALWIVKSSRGARGRGIVVVDAVPTDTTVALRKGVVQRYVVNPLLIDGRKFHLRLYVVVASIAPLRVLMSHTGLLMVAAEAFSADPAAFTNRRIHLTNSAVGATVAPLVDFWRRLSGLGWSASKQRALWQAFADLAVKVAFSSQVAPPGGADSPRPGRPHHFEWRKPGTCFDLLGFDVTVTAAGRPVLLEVNNGPEVLSEQPLTHPVNEAVHTEMLTELLAVVAAPRSAAAPEELARFWQLVQTRLLGSRIPLVVTEAGNFSSPITLCHGVRLRLDYRDVVNDETADRPDGPWPRCVTTADLLVLWESYDERRSIRRFEAVYPVGCDDRYADLYLQPEPWLSRLNRRWLAIVDGCA
mmetsp:Transcript_7442/g.19126  ORF Transcript_7442/g.19126 Transcript_7442/m.19126 type:complete len:558 (+) Transcript_7442:172-1845(+)